ncbi:winged helix-turn-helix transcriptional regulator [Gordonia soli]|uniref:Putative HxlR family transcriptional regulator n=1 Tax=Gordonia soli NBRC 108243 TaxID=1223545 RepID=M0QEY0_9ACTN|nr:helix-turn-helix domain-containing protein [Gordonia soli]GAC67009.1 putative HxlR family transcriptional regulator [Gordonia soli NBRC 108243]
MPRRSYQHYCAIGRALDVVGDRWSLLIVRELCGGARRYSDLFADLPGISTDVLATRLRELEGDGLVVRRKIGPRAGASVYELTHEGRSLRPVLASLGDWGAHRLGERGDQDAVRAHWLAFPLGGRIAEQIGAGTVNVRIGAEQPFHVVVGDGAVEHRDGEIDTADVDLELDLDAAIAVVRGERSIDSARSGGTERL